MRVDSDTLCLSARYYQDNQNSRERKGRIKKCNRQMRTEEVVESRWDIMCRVAKKTQTIKGVF